MQTITIVLFTALMLGFFFLFLTPGRWWPRQPPENGSREPPADEDDAPDPPRYPESLN